MPAGMMGDRASVIFAAPEEITKMIEARCRADTATTPRLE
jgi:cytochrome c